MVKNLTGGSRHKSMARKAFNAPRGALRKKDEEGELYAVVTKILGGSMCHVVGMDKVARNCVIRGKFRGGKKRDNTIRTGVLVLVGDRDWSSVQTGKLPVCDLLEVYSDADKDRLKTLESGVDWGFSLHVGETCASSSTYDTGLEFGENSINEEYEQLVKDETTKIIGGMDLDFTHDEEIDLEDI